MQIYTYYKYLNTKVCIFVYLFKIFTVNIQQTYLGIIHLLGEERQWGKGFDNPKPSPGYATVHRRHVCLARPMPNFDSGTQ